MATKEMKLELSPSRRITTSSVATANEARKSKIEMEQITEGIKS